MAVWLSAEHLTVECAEEPLAPYTVTHQPDRRHLRTVDEPRLFDTPFRSPQLPLWELSDAEWVKALPLPSPVRHRKQQPTDGAQAPLFAKQRPAPEVGVISDGPAVPASGECHYVSEMSWRGVCMTNLDRRIAALESRRSPARRRRSDPAHPVFAALAERGLRRWSDERVDWVLLADLRTTEAAYIEASRLLDPDAWSRM